MCKNGKGFCPGPIVSPMRRCLQCEAEFKAAAAVAPPAPAPPPLPAALAAIVGTATPAAHPGRVAGTLGVGEQFNLTAASPGTRSCRTNRTMAELYSPPAPRKVPSPSS